MTKIYLIRHAEAEGNLYRRAHGQFDSLLTEKGLRQVAELQKRFVGETIDAVYSSDLYRARQTAAAVSELRGLEIRPTELLREVNMGVWEDRTWGEIIFEVPEMMHTFNNDPASWHIENSEDFYDLRRRMTGVLSDIAKKHDGKKVAAVSHGCAIRAFLSGVMGIKSEDIRALPYCDNTAVALLAYDGGAFAVEYHGDNTHLLSAKGDLGQMRHFSGWQKGSTAPGDENLLRFERGSGDNFVARFGDKPAAALRLDTARDAAGKAGWIADYTVYQQYRNRGVGVQLLGQAVSSYRRLGRDCLRLEVLRDNEGAIRFFEKYGFKRIRGSGAGVILEKDISRPFASA